MPLHSSWILHVLEFSSTLGSSPQYAVLAHLKAIWFCWFEIFSFTDCPSLSLHQQFPLAKSIPVLFVSSKLIQNCTLFNCNICLLQLVHPQVFLLYSFLRFSLFFFSFLLSQSGFKVFPPQLQNSSVSISSLQKDFMPLQTYWWRVLKNLATRRSFLNHILLLPAQFHFLSQPSDCVSLT